MMRILLDVLSLMWSPKVVFIRYFVVTPIIVFLIWLIVR